MALNISFRKHPEKVLRYVNDAISLFQPRTTNLQGPNNIIKFEKYLYILGGIIKIPNMLYNNDEKRYLIRKALMKFARYNRHSLYLFCRAIEAVRKERKLPKNPYYVIFPTKLPRKINRKRFFKVENVRLYIRSPRYIRDKFKIPKNIVPQTIFKELGRIYNSRFTCLEIKLSARDSDEAFSKAYWWFEIFRALINLNMSYGKKTYQLGKPKPLAKFLPPKYMPIFNHKGIYEDYWFTYPTYDYRIIYLRPNQIVKIDKLVKRYNKLKRNPLKNLLTEALGLYNFALDEIERGHSFLNFWQVLEIIALKYPQVTYKDMIQRVKLIFKNPITSDLVDALLDKRHRLVHEGTLSQFSLEDVNQIKIIAELCLSFLFRYVNTLQTKPSLQDFYDALVLEKSEIRERRRVLAHVLRI